MWFVHVKCANAAPPVVDVTEQGGRGPHFDAVVEHLLVLRVDGSDAGLVVRRLHDVRVLVSGAVLDAQSPHHHALHLMAAVAKKYRSDTARWASAHARSSRARCSGSDASSSSVRTNSSS